MKKPFKIGEIVFVYDNGDRFKATIKEVMPSNRIVVETCNGLKARLLILPQQCRRLVKKERRRFWIKDLPIFGMDFANCVVTERPGADGWIEVIEVKKK